MPALSTTSASPGSRPANNNGFERQHLDQSDPTGVSVFIAYAPWIIVYLGPGVRCLIWHQKLLSHLAPEAVEGVMRLLIVGASGLIGSYLKAAAEDAGHLVIGTFASRSRDGLVHFDLMRDRIDDLVTDLGPEDRVFLLSAHIQPDWVYRHPVESRSLNVDATARCFDDVMARGAHVVFVSSESVFGEDREDGYGEDASPNPSTLYARQKVEIEEYLTNSDARTCIVRTGWTVGWEPEFYCPVRNTYESLMSGTAKMARDNFFTLTDVCDTVTGLLALAKSSHTGVVHVASNPPIGRVELADRIIATSRFGANMDYEAVTFSSLEFLEPRPRCAWLRNVEARGLMEMEFGEPSATVTRKVALLDQWLSNGEET